MNKKTSIIILAVAILAIGGYLVLVKPNTGAPARVTFDPLNATYVEYRNDQYGFSIPLAETWKGFSVLKKTWEGWPINGMENAATSTHGHLLVIRHPNWTVSEPREDMPVMVFTPGEWDLVMQEKLSLGAAPIHPSKLGENSKYIFALPARYNYDYKTGWEEVDQLVHKLTAFEPVP